MKRDELIEVLTEEDQDLRAQSYDQVWIEMDDEQAATLLDIAVTGETEELRGAAMIALGPLIEECGGDYDEELGFEWPEELGPSASRETFKTVTDTLRKLYEDETQPKFVRRSALEALVRDGRPWMVEPIRRHFKGNDEDWKLTSIFAMGWVPGLEDDILEAVRTTSGRHLSVAIDAASQREIKGVAGIVRKLATSDKTESDVRISAILALPTVLDDAFDLLQELSESSDDDVVAAAEEALEELEILSAGDDLDDDDFDDDFDDDDDAVEGDEKT